MEPPTRNEVLQRLGKYDRQDKEGGLFEIYKIKPELINQIKNGIDNFINNKQLKFIKICETGNKPPKFLKKIPEKYFEPMRNYLIREKNTLRWANSEERELISEEESESDTDEEGTEDGREEIDNEETPSRNPATQNINNIESSAAANSLTPNINPEGPPSVPRTTTTELSDGDLKLSEKFICKLMKESYGRMAMANYRARNRYNRLTDQYQEVFKFKKSSEKAIIRGTTLQSNVNYRGTEYIDVKLAEESKSLTLKKVFEILQVYNTGEKFDKDNINESMPLHVRLDIGRRKVYFMLSSFTGSAMRQISVSVKENNDGHFVRHGYQHLIERFKGNNGKTLAKDLLQCLDAKMNKQPKVFRKYQGEDIPYIVEFLALTQISEANHGGQKYENSRTPGMNKLARRLLRQIKEGELTFEQAFTWDGNRDKKKAYPAAASSGTSIAKEAVYTIKKIGTECFDMSDDSDSNSNSD